MEFVLFVVYITLIWISFLALAKIIDEYFVDSLEVIAKRLKLSHEAAGATLMAFGTSAPELFITLFALWLPGAHVDLGAGTIVGSVIFNILVIIGTTAFFHTTTIRWQPVIRDAVFYGFTIIFLLFVLRDNAIDVVEAAGFLLAYVVYVVVVLKWKKLFHYRDTPGAMETLQKDLAKRESRWLHKRTLLAQMYNVIDALYEKVFPDVKKNPHLAWPSFGLSIVGIALLTFVLVQSSIGIGDILGVPDIVIALTVLAVGSGLPDLFASMAVASHGRSDMAISNAFGSNIVNVLVGLGLPLLVYSAYIGEPVPIDNAALVGSVVILFGSLLMAVSLFALNKFKTHRSIGVILLASYGLYMLYNLYQAFLAV